MQVNSSHGDASRASQMPAEKLAPIATAELQADAYIQPVLQERMAEVAAAVIECANAPSRLSENSNVLAP